MIDFAQIIKNLPEKARTDSNIIRAIRGLPPLLRGGVREGGFEQGNQHGPRSKKNMSIPFKNWRNAHMAVNRLINLGRHFSYWYEIGTDCYVLATETFDDYNEAHYVAYNKDPFCGDWEKAEKR